MNEIMAIAFCIVTFYSTHLALKFERLIKGRGLEVKLIPVPRRISSSCGIAGRISEAQLTEVKTICQEDKIEYESIYLVFDDQSKEPELLL